MFQERLKFFIIIVLAGIGLLIGRLAWLQLATGDRYDATIADLLQCPPEWIETDRGAIYDCTGRALALDIPSYQIQLRYDITRLYDKYFRRYQFLRFYRQQLKEGLSEARAEEAAAAFIDKNFGEPYLKAQQWLQELASICGAPIDRLLDDIAAINRNILRVRAYLARKRWYANHPELDYQSVTGLEGILEDLAAVIPDEYERLKLIFYGNAIEEMTIPQPVLDPLDRETALMVEQQFLGSFLPGSEKNRPILIGTGKVRNYPFNDLAGHLIGQVGPAPVEVTHPVRSRHPSPDELVAYYLGDRSGDWGVEYLFEPILRGSRGWIKRDIDGEIVEQIERRFGADVKLSIDIELHRAIQKIFAGENSNLQAYQGGAVVIDVPTGQVRALVSYPGFNLNSYYQADNYALLNGDDPERRKLNRTLSVNWQTGSTIKPAFLLGALHYGILNENTELDCNESNKDWSGYPSDINNHGPIAAREAVMRSCNYYFIRVAEKLGADRLTDWLTLMGFGHPILAWPDPVYQARAGTAFRETAGHIAPIGKRFPSKSELRFMGIGRGALDASVLQMANAAAMIARDGLFIAPHLVIEPATYPATRQLAEPAQARVVQNAMKAVIYDRLGTGYKAFHPMPWSKETVELMAKTGSTDFSLFVCIAKAADGRCLAVATLAESGLHGSEVAAPLTLDILRACAQLDYLPRPDLEP